MIGLTLDPPFLDQPGGQRVFLMEAERADDADFLADDGIDRNRHLAGDADLGNI